MNGETKHVLLAGCLVAMYVQAMFSLCRRPLTRGQFTAWGYSHCWSRRWDPSWSS
jgi:hypothetical protein